MAAWPVSRQGQDQKPVSAAAGAHLPRRHPPARTAGSMNTNRGGSMPVRLSQAAVLATETPWLRTARFERDAHEFHHRYGFSSRVPQLIGFLVHVPG
jgi:hypothetical protein